MVNYIYKLWANKSLAKLCPNIFAFDYAHMNKKMKHILKHIFKDMNKLKS